MRFEHLVEINDLSNPLIPSLSRAQLWAGLLLRVENPVPFTIGLDRFEVETRYEEGVARALHFGQTVIRDRVSLIDQQQVHYEIQPEPGQTGGSLTMSIEEPEAQRLFVRFVYQMKLAKDAEPVTEEYQAFLKQAYEQADLDTIRIIKEMTGSY